MAQARTRIAFTDQGLICPPVWPCNCSCLPFIGAETQIDEMFDKLGKALDKVFKEVA